VQDSKTGDIILKLVNYSKEVKSMNINLSAFKKFMQDAEQTVFADNSEAENTFDNPGVVVPVTATYRVSKRFDYMVPAMSLNVIRIKTNNKAVNTKRGSWTF
jgi:alpha-L-arabinofuranosidase